MSCRPSCKEVAVYQRETAILGQEDKTKRVIVNWDILPRGEYPWSSIKETLGNLAKEHTKTQTRLMLRNCESIYERSPDFVAYGRAGFRGYAVFGFTSKNLYVLESAFPNNATYVLQNDWETISQMSKAEILSQDLHKARIVHSESWFGCPEDSGSGSGYFCWPWFSPPLQMVVFPPLEPVCAA